MKFGLCTDFKKNDYGYYIPNLAFIEKCGFDYLELNMTSIAKLSDDEFDKLVKYFENSDLKVLCCNCLMNNAIQMVGEKRDLIVLEEYMEKVTKRAKKLGIEKLVVGSGGSRRVKPGGDYNEAYNELKESFSLMATVASRNNIKLCPESLNISEVNLVGTFEETCDLINEVNHENLYNTLDFYHFNMGKEDKAIISKYKDNIIHVHYARLLGRVFPLLEDFVDLEPDLKALKDIGYDGSFSMECSFANIENEPYEYLATIPKIKEFFNK